MRSVTRNDSRYRDMKRADRVMEGEKRVNERGDRVNKRVDNVNERGDRVNKRVDSVNKRVDCVNERTDCVIERADRINNGTDGRTRACSSRTQKNDQRILSIEKNLQNKENRNPVHIKNSRMQMKKTNTNKNIIKTKTKSKNNLMRFLLATAVVAAAVCLILVSNKKVVSADESGKEPQLNKYYKSITIEPGDTLWSIAEEYKSGAYKTTKDYVEELMDMNGVHSGRITSGQKLVVAYFAE